MAARQDMTTAFYRLYYSGVSIMINATRQEATLSGTVVLEHFQTVSVVDGHCYISAVWFLFVVHHTDNTDTHTQVTQHRHNTIGTLVPYQLDWEAGAR